MSWHAQIEKCKQSIMYGFCDHFNNLRFERSQSLNDLPAAHVVISFVSSDMMNCRLLKWLLDHPMNIVSLQRNDRHGVNKSCGVFWASEIPFATPRRNKQVDHAIMKNQHREFDGNGLLTTCPFTAQISTQHQTVTQTNPWASEQHG